MTTIVDLHWYGDKVRSEVLRAAQWGMDSVMADCVRKAKTLVPKKTTVLQGSIQMRPTVAGGDQLTGYWGSFSVKYARWVEEGTGPHIILPRNKKALFWKGADHPVRMVSHPGTKARPYLIPAAEEHYPSLALRIRAQLEWGTK